MVKGKVMKKTGKLIVTLLLTGSASILFASDNLEDGTSDRMFEKNAEYKDAKHHRNDYKASPFYIGKTMDGVKNSTYDEEDSNRRLVSLSNILSR